MNFRSATIEDVEMICNLIDTYASSNMMLKRPKALLYERIREFVIAEEDREIIGIGALSIIWKDLAEVRSLAVKESQQGKGIGRAIIEQLEKEAKGLGIERVFTLTYQVDFFTKLDYAIIDKESLPQKVWKDCINCDKFPNCDETAMIKYMV